MKTKVFFTLMVLAIFAQTISAQEKEKRFGFELSSGLSIALNELNGAKLKPDFGYEGIFHYRFMPHTGVYAGWGWNRFASDKSFIGDNVDFEETGYIIGLQFKHPISNSSVNYYLRGGALYNHIEIENEGDILKDSGHGWGWQAAGGIDIPLGKNWSLTPGVKFNSLSRDVDHNSFNVPLDLNYLQFRVGILKTF
ncbi:MAG: outer membrane beta-barrel protein [Bacteroidota bacterium]|nr:outer membrane beta-barrel protein [Bacteroidota bacterium]